MAVKGRMPPFIFLMETLFVLYIQYFTGAPPQGGGSGGPDPSTTLGLRDIHNVHVTYNPRRAGARHRTRRARGVWTPPLTRFLGHVATRGKRHSKERQTLLRNCCGHFLGHVKGQVTRGHQRSNFAFFNIFSYKSTHNSRTGSDQVLPSKCPGRASAPRWIALDSPFNVLSITGPQICRKINGLAYREQKF